MAFNWQTFRTRTITSIIFAAVMIGGLLLNHWTFFFLFSIIHFGCWIEYQKLLGLIDKGYTQITPFHKYGVMLAGWCLMLWFSSDNYIILGIRLHELGWWIGLLLVFLLPVTELLFTKHIELKNILYSALGLVYISLSLGLMMDLSNPHTSPDIYYFTGSRYKVELPLLIIVSLWINDTMAYLVGSLLGKTPLTSISPKKTWEGTGGGIILCVVLIALVTTWMGFPGNEVTNYAIIAAIAAIAGTAGDLLESKLKRMAGVKDSGSIMPGHGGFLDRFDSLLVTIPFAWIYIYSFIR
jgi:phosphatidate cytidylyltransferase